MPSCRSTRAILAVTACLVAALPAAAEAAALGTRALSAGSSGGDVVQLQRALVKLGHRVSVDGQYGSETKRAVRRFERANAMTVDGRVSRRDARRIARSAARAAAGAGGATPDAPAQQTETESAPAAVAPTHFFPVQGIYSLGTTANVFGAPRGGRSHQGHDVLAAEGTPLVAVTAGRVHWVGHQDAGAGHYIVVRGTDGFDYAYMHLRDRPLPARGDAVAAGEQIGYVGNTGASSGAHLHFEMWRGAWQDGGVPVDPLPYLQRWAG